MRATAGPSRLQCSCDMCSAVRVLAVLGAVAAARASDECTELKITVPDVVLYNGYHVREGPFEVFCSSDTNNLLILGESDELRTVVLNSTTVKTIVEGKSDVRIVCQLSNVCFKYVSIYVEYTPNMNKFKCFSDNFKSLTCSWCASYSRNFTLDYTDQPNHDIRICNGENKGKNNHLCKLCVWELSNLISINYIYKTKLQVPLRLQMCNLFECVYQQAEVDLETVTKLDAPKIVESHRSYQYGTILIEWRLDLDYLRQNFNTHQLPIHYKIEYTLAGVQQFQLISNTTKVITSIPLVFTHFMLPCPDKQYIVRISCRPARAGPEYMSDFAYTSVRTKPDPFAPKDPKCEVKPEAVKTPPVMVYDVQLLRQKVYENLAQFGERRRRLKDKLAEINKLPN